MEVVCNVMAMKTQGARWAVAGAGRLECVPYLCTGTISLWAGLVGANLLLQLYLHFLDNSADGFNLILWLYC